nr:cation-translocating P-type ATPase [Noviherbaspirillum massiliense]
MKQAGQAPRGCSAEEAARRLKQEGYNELPAKRKRDALHIVLEVLCEPMFLLLLGAGLIYLLLGDAGDALMLLGFVFITMGITIVQERRTERVLETLRDLSSPRALVIRDGEQERVPGREVVRGDLLVIEEGDRVAADAALIEAHDLLVDESLLTGESVAVAKQAPDKAPGPEQTDSGDAGSRVYSGTMVVQGGGLARVTAVGAQTELGKIGKSLQALPTEKSPLQREIGMLVKRFALLGSAVSLLVFTLYGIARADWMNGLLAGITLAMSVLPEEFTVILTVFMALGAWRISRSRVLTRHTPVIEALGSATVLCVDKTGTLTQNRMSVKAAVIDGREFAIEGAHPDTLPDEVRRLLECSVLASEIMPFDPMEKAIHRSLDSLSPDAGKAHRGWSLVHEYPLTRDFLAMTHVWEGTDGCRVATKGAPETIARLCRLGPEKTKEVLEQVRQLAAQGMRVLGVARASCTGKPWPSQPDAFAFTWLGLIALADPLRPPVPAAVRECHQAGIRVVMITGDYPATAQAIAKEAGIPSHRVMTGAELESLDAAALAQAVREVQVFARIRPEQKLRLVTAFKSNGEVVAMTGDGVNDAPALKAAHIGISMGERGTDVAREASSLVLLNDDFASIVHAIGLGRRIYDNLRKALTYIVAVHLPIAGMALLPLLLGAPLAFAPIHIVFLEMIINPACAVVFETEHAESGIMQRPPRSIAERLFGARDLAFAVLQGLGLLAVVAAIYFLGLRAGLQAAEARALAFTCVVLGNLSLIVVNRSMRHGVLELLRIPNQAQWWVLGSTAVALLAALYIPALQNVFHFAPVQGRDLMWPVAAGIAAMAWFEFVKYGFRQKTL